ncbi:MAG: TIGR02996 domain-containing protein [Gemmataceae bacterium]|nr:TIGR02996 domain-containing protein [Gemmataceae bacterium]
MSDEKALLAAIAADPCDALARLAYADWLEERGDARAELVRIEEEMARLAPFSDRYWKLKPRRNELRAASDEDWLEAMRYGTDCPPLFAHGVPEGVKERWRLVREFVERWHKEPMPDVGGRAAEGRSGYRGDVAGFDPRVDRVLA